MERSEPAPARAEVPTTPTFELWAVLYAEGEKWVARGLQFDIVAQGNNPVEAGQRLIVKIGGQIAIAVDLKRTALPPQKSAAEEYWRLYHDAGMDAQLKGMDIVPISVGNIAFNIIPKFRIGVQQSAKKMTDAPKRRVA